MNELMPVYDEIYDQLTQIMDIKVDEGQTVSNVLAIVIIILTVIIVIIIGIAIAFAISLGKGIANSIAVPLDQIMQRLDIFAKGVLSSPFPTVDTQDELADMVTVTTNMAASLQFIIHDVAQVLHQMASANFAVVSKDRSKYVGEFEGILTAMKLLKKQMAETLRSVGEASNQVSAGANNLSMASQSLAEGAADQAGAIEEMQATITTISDDIRVTAKNAEESYTQARTYADEAERSRREMKAMMGAMSRINEASQQVGNIISEIEAIASQTNLLSLNASIEAARAGEAGRGFAVVATEISNLANQTQSATVDITDVIRSVSDKLRIAAGTVEELMESNRRQSESAVQAADSFEKIATDTEQVDEQSRRLDRSVKQLAEANRVIVESIQTISAIMQEVSAHSQETFRVSENNTKIVEEVDRLVEGLSDQAKQLNRSRN